MSHQQKVLTKRSSLSSPPAKNIARSLLLLPIVKDNFCSVWSTGDHLWWTLPPPSSLSTTPASSWVDGASWRACTGHLPLKHLFSNIKDWTINNLTTDSLWCVDADLLGDVETSHLCNSIDSFIFCVTNDHWNVREVVILMGNRIIILQRKRWGKRPARNQVGLWGEKEEFLSRGWERVRRGLASKGLERCSSPAVPSCSRLGVVGPSSLNVFWCM